MKEDILVLPKFFHRDKLKKTGLILVWGKRILKVMFTARVLGNILRKIKQNLGHFCNLEESFKQ